MRKTSNIDYIQKITMESRRAFTFWELLIIIFVIFILIGLLMPALTRVRRMSTRMVCESNLNIYGKAGLLYLGDNDNLFPTPSDEWLYRKASISELHPIGCRWHDRAMSPTGRLMSENEQYQGKMWSYIEQSDIGPCPTFRQFARSRGCESPEHNGEVDIEPQNSYTMNGYLGSAQEGGVLRANEVRDPGTVFFFAEENNWSVRPDHPRFPDKDLKAALSTRALDDTLLLILPSPQAGDCFATYHDAPSGDLNRGYGNAVFIDGHVEPISAKDQLRKTMHGGKSYLNPAGNLFWAWASITEPPGGWDAQ